MSKISSSSNQLIRNLLHNYKQLLHKKKNKEKIKKEKENRKKEEKDGYLGKEDFKRSKSSITDFFISGMLAPSGNSVVHLLTVFCEVLFYQRSVGCNKSHRGYIILLINLFIDILY